MLDGAWFERLGQTGCRKVRTKIWHAMVGWGALVDGRVGALLGSWMGLPPTLGTGALEAAVTAGVGTWMDGGGAEAAPGGDVVPPGVHPAARATAAARTNRAAHLRTAPVLFLTRVSPCPS